MFGLASIPRPQRSLANCRATTRSCLTCKAGTATTRCAFVVFIIAIVAILLSSLSSIPPPAILPFFRSFLHLWEQVVTSSQHLSHFFRQVKGRLQTTQILVGRFSFCSWAERAARGRER